jgi:hypothetical protein
MIVTIGNDLDVDRLREWQGADQVVVAGGSYVLAAAGNP